MKEANQTRFFCWCFSPPEAVNTKPSIRQVSLLAFCNSTNCYNKAGQKQQVPNFFLKTTATKKQLQLWQMLQLLPFVNPVHTCEAHCALRTRLQFALALRFLNSSAFSPSLSTFQCNTISPPPAAQPLPPHPVQLGSQLIVYHFGSAPAWPISSVFSLSWGSHQNKEEKLSLLPSGCQSDD